MSLDQKLGTTGVWFFTDLLDHGRSRELAARIDRAIGEADGFFNTDLRILHRRESQQLFNHIAKKRGERKLGWPADSIITKLSNVRGVGPFLFVLTWFCAIDTEHLISTFG